MVLVCEYLKVKSLEDLEAEHGIKSRVHGHKVSLNYDQIEAQEDDPMVAQCRGLILRPAEPRRGSVAVSQPLGDTVVLARPFDRFFNYGQSAAANVDFNHPATAFYEKLDGTFCIVYYDDVKHEWHVGTRAVPEANLPIDGFGDHTFRSLFEKALKETTSKEFHKWSSEHLFRDTTYMFELTTPLNRIVVDYGGYGITLLGARKTQSGKELNPAFVQAQVRTPTADRFRFSSVSELVSFVSKRDPTKHEGIVVCDHKFRRVKVKNAGYVALSKVRDSALKSPRGLVELILLEKLDDALPLLPENIMERAEKLQKSFRKMISEFREKYNSCLDEANKTVPIFNENSPALHREHRKVFALAVQEHNGWLAPMMSIYLGKVGSFTDWISSKKNPDGGWSNNFLDTILNNIEK